MDSDPRRYNRSAMAELLRRSRRSRDDGAQRGTGHEGGDSRHSLHGDDAEIYSGSNGPEMPGSRRPPLVRDEDDDEM